MLIKPTPKTNKSKKSTIHYENDFFAFPMCIILLIGIEIEFSILNALAKRMEIVCKLALPELWKLTRPPRPRLKTTTANRKSKTDQVCKLHN